MTIYNSKDYPYLHKVEISCVSSPEQGVYICKDCAKNQTSLHKLVKKKVIRSVEINDISLCQTLGCTNLTHKLYMFKSITDLELIELLG